MSKFIDGVLDRHLKEYQKLTNLKLFHFRKKIILGILGFSKFRRDFSVVINDLSDRIIFLEDENESLMGRLNALEEIFESYLTDKIEEEII